MSEFHDPDLRQELGRLSGPYPDDNIAFAAWQRRVGQVRRRRMVAWTATAALSLVVGTVAFAAVQSPGRRSVVPGESADSSVSVTLRVATTEVEDPSTVPAATEPEASEPTTLAAETAPPVVDTAAPETEAPDAAAAPSNGSPPKNNNGTPPTPAPSRMTQTFSSVGGTITVRQDGDTLTVIAKSPAPGFRATESDDPGDEVDVVFKSDKHESRITVKLSHGVMKSDTNESEHDHDNDHPTTTDGDSHHGGGGDGSGSNKG
ncbi:MAG: hypothetical protein ABI894_00095 [Ilumatobacteraceae bacterium]